MRWFLNTFIVATFTCLLSTVVVLLTSYTFSRLRFKGRQNLMKGIMIMGMFPGFMSMIAIYFILKGMGLLPSGTEQVPVANYLVALILVYSGGAAMDTTFLKVSLIQFLIQLMKQQKLMEPIKHKFSGTLFFRFQNQSLSIQL